jgi:2-dehydro-3-deoxyphosphogluconate aldolase/(4S)-4-hydroxy-2-oxoglutarate aldolase
VLAISEITAHGVVPVVVLDDTAQAVPLADALAAGDLPIAEITLRTPAAAGAIAAMAGRRDILVGAGTVRTPAQVDLAVDAGARFLVSPGLRADVVARAALRDVPLLPGCATASELMAAEALGISTVKFFPAAQYGGAAAVAALAAAFPDFTFVPTGGITLGSLQGYLRLPAVPAVGGSWMVAPAARGDFDEVTRLCAETVATARTS